MPDDAGIGGRWDVCFPGLYANVCRGCDVEGRICDRRLSLPHGPENKEAP